MRAAEEDLERPGGGKGYVIESVGLESKSDSELAREEWEAEFTVLVAAFWWTSPLEVGDERVLLQAPCSLWIRLSRHWLGAWFWEVWGSLEDCFFFWSVTVGHRQRTHHLHIPYPFQTGIWSPALRTN